MSPPYNKEIPKKFSDEIPFIEEKISYYREPSRIVTPP